MPTQILVLNCGSSSVKYQMIDVDSEKVLASGLVEKIGLEDGNITHKTHGDQYRIDETIANHTEALALVTRAFHTWGPALEESVAVGHRIVHGGDKYRQPTLITAEVLQGLTDLSDLAPLHNPPAIAGIKAAQQVLASVPHVAIFDTAFFGTLPEESYLYAINREVCEQYGIRKYGFHGTSHDYVSKQAAEFLGVDLASVNQIVCHLGNGASISAVKGGIAVDTSMGMTPLEGLVMGTRSGDIDPGLFSYLEREAGMGAQEVDTLLNKQSGMWGLADGSSDHRDIWDKIEAGDVHASQAIAVYVHRLVSYIGAYAAVLGHLDLLVFTAGVGENDFRLRERVLDRLGGFGVRLDPQRNAVRSSEPRIISADDSTLRVLVVPTNEELSMARQTYQLIR
ncbi:MAG: acetate kinase [Propionibacteriaceae bacterium]|nr:acetate kinase [Propionibacteriaceae bacterium]